MTRRYPFQPLLNAADLPRREVRRQLGISGTNWQDYLNRGVTTRVADRLACAIGHHPAEIWPEWIDHAIEDITVDHKDCAECGQPFEASSPRRRFCKPQCRKNHHSRAWKSTPEGRRRNQEARRQYYAENRRYELARQRRYDSDTKNKNTAATATSPDRPPTSSCSPPDPQAPHETVNPAALEGAA